MATRNDITGDAIATKAASDAYRDNYDAIFRKKAVPKAEVTVEVIPEKTPEELAKELRDAQTKRWWAYCEQHQREPKGSVTFAEFRDTILPTLPEGAYNKFL